MVQSIFVDQPAGHWLLRLGDGRESTTPGVPVATMSRSMLLPEPAEIFDPSPAPRWKVRRVDAKGSDPAHGIFLIILTNGGPGAAQAREEWLVQETPALLLSRKVFPVHSQKTPAVAVTISWQAVGGIQVPATVTRRLLFGGVTLETVSTWRDVEVNPVLPGDWFPVGLGGGP